MNLLSSILNAKSAVAPAPAAQTAAVPTGILPPEAPKTMQGTMLGQPVTITLPPVPAEPFQAVPPPHKTPPMPSLEKKARPFTIQDPTPEGPPKVEQFEQARGDETRPFTAEENAAVAAAIAAAPKKRGRPPGSKSKAADTLPPGSTGTGGIAQAIQNHISENPSTGMSLTVRSITVTRSATVQVVQFEPMRIDVSVTADVVGLSVAEATHLLDQQVMSELVRRMEQLHSAKKDLSILKAESR